MPNTMEKITAGDQVVCNSSASKRSRGWFPLVMLGAATVALAAIAWRGRAGRPASALQVVRCPIHGIAYDAQLEVCPECAKPAAADMDRRRSTGTH